MLVLVLEFSKISAPTLYPLPISGMRGTSRDERPREASSKELVAPPKRKTRVQTYVAVT